jgi:hypothetical protein
MRARDSVTHRVVQLCDAVGCRFILANVELNQALQHVTLDDEAALCVTHLHKPSQQIKQFCNKARRCGWERGTTSSGQDYARKICGDVASSTRSTLTTASINADTGDTYSNTVLGSVCGSSLGRVNDVNASYLLSSNGFNTEMQHRRRSTIKERVDACGQRSRSLFSQSVRVLNAWKSHRSATQSSGSRKQGGHV